MADYSWASVFWVYSIMAMFVLGAAFFLVKAIRSGAVSGDEAPKYRMLEDEPEMAGRFRPVSAGGNDERQA